MNVSNDMSVAGNYDPSGVPADNDVIFFNDQTEQAPTVGMTHAAKNFDVIVEKGCRFAIGGVGNALKPDTFGRIIYEGSASVPSFFEAALAGGIAQVVVNTSSTKRGVVNLDGTIKRADVRSGSCEVTTGATIDTQISVGAQAGARTAEIIIPSGVTLSGVNCALNGGTVECSSDIPTVKVNKGDFRLISAADVTTLLEVYDGGSFLWESFTTSSITLAEIYGGLFQTVKERIGRTLTHMNIYGKGVADFRAGGLSVAITDPIEVYGENPPLFPKGAKFAITV